MPIKFEDEDEGKVLAIQVSGKLTMADYVYFAPEFERLVQLNGNVRVLFDLAGFDGWETSALWEGIKFDVKHFADVERIAMIGETRWEKGMATFAKPFTKATIRYFDHAKTAEARKWLGEP
ncbi:MAG: STAS/SEC14 domain-containing protein [Verrucomicrobiae bacterium]|nr:STAS/SEC14 domain-containing protein [Verrucomicrobiae bacterium]